MWPRWMIALCLMALPCCRPIEAQESELSRVQLRSGPRTEVQTYEAAIARSEAEGLPLVVFFDSHTCAPCKAYWDETIEPMRKAGEFDRVALARVAIEDREQLAKDSKIKTTPTVLAYVRRGGTWVRYRMERTQSRERVKELLDHLR